MTHYILRRLAVGCLTLLCVTFIVYALIRHMPGTPLTALSETMDPGQMMDEADYKRIERIYGLDLPWYEAYLYWLGSMLQGDFGPSFRLNQPVLRVIGERVGPTLYLSVTSLALTYLLAIPLGLYSSARNGKWDERVISTFLYMLYSVPVFVAALLLQIVFAVRWNWFSLDLMHSSNFDQLGFVGKIGDLFHHSVLPVACYTYGGLAYYSRFIRANMAEVMQQDYIRTARAKGVPESRVVVKHAFRNTMIPMVTLMGLMLPGLLSGSVILEQIFTWPGMGRLFFESIASRDYPVIMGLTFFFSILTLIGTLLSDVLYAVVDPRVSYS